MITIRAPKSGGWGALTTRFVAVCCVISVLPTISLGVTTTHYDKPPETKLHPSEIKIEKLQKRLANLTVTERQKRLLPYINFYVTQNMNQPYNEEVYQDGQRFRLISPSKINYQPVQTKFSELIATAYQPDKDYETQQLLYQQKSKFTPFLESNALPGPFVPMAKPQPQKIKIDYTPLEQSEKIPNYSAIYDKLSQLKLQQTALDAQNNGPQYILGKNPQINYIPVQQYEEQSGYAPIQPPATYVHRYTPTSIEVTNNGDMRYESQEQLNQNEELPAEIVPQEPIRVTQIHNPRIIAQQPIRLAHINNPKEIITQQPIRLTQINNAKHQYAILEEPLRQVPPPNYLALTKNHYIVHEQKPYHTQNHKQYLQEIIPNNKAQPLIFIPQKSPQIQYAESPKQEQIKVPKPILILQPTTTQGKAFTIQQQNYQPLPAIQEIPQQTATPAPEIQTENPNSLSQILKRLQESNALPQTLTPDNIDNSIKTLVSILSSLKKQQKVTARPIIVPDEETSYEEQENEAGVGLGESHGTVPGTTVEFFPAHTPEGGTPGKPGVDYPALSSIPQTNFNCKTQRYKGFFADPDTHCQVWHYCDLNGGQASFLCPNGTIFSQVALTCDWWFNVKCSTTTQLYVLNERLYKYIIPLTPKFPEDYTGPLVDRYLALKFKEMEEKMKNEKKDKKPATDKNDEIDELQLLEDETRSTERANAKKLKQDSTEAVEDENEGEEEEEEPK